MLLASVFPPEMAEVSISAPPLHVVTLFGMTQGILKALVWSGVGARREKKEWHLFSIVATDGKMERYHPPGCFEPPLCGLSYGNHGSSCGSASQGQK